MNKNEFKLLVENWRKVLKEDNSNSSDDDDLYAPVGDSEPDQLDNDINYVQSQVDSYRASDAEKEAELERFCRMFGIQREEVAAFIANQAFDAGYKVRSGMEGEEFDPNEIPDDMPDDDYVDDDDYDG